MTSCSALRRVSCAAGVLLVSVSWPSLAADTGASSALAATLKELRASAAKGAAGAPPIVAALKDSRAAVRAAAVQLLPAAKGTSAVADVAPLVDDKEES